MGLRPRARVELRYDMEWSVRAKLFLEGHGTARWNGSEMNNLNQVQSSWRY